MNPLLRNNLVALAIAVAVSVVTMLTTRIFAWDYPVFLWCSSIAAVLMYVIGGVYFLKPVDRHSYLSVGFVFAAWITFVPLALIFDKAGEGASHYILIALNPLSYVAVTYPVYIYAPVGYLALIFLPALIPSLLIWIGLLIKTRVCVLKIRKENSAGGV